MMDIAFLPLQIKPYTKFPAKFTAKHITANNI